MFKKHTVVDCIELLNDQIVAKNFKVQTICAILNTPKTIVAYLAA